MTKAPPKESCCASGHRIFWHADGKGLEVCRVGAVTAAVVQRLNHREWWELRCCPLCGAAILPVA